MKTKGVTGMGMTAKDSNKESSRLITEREIKAIEFVIKHEETLDDHDLTQLGRMYDE